MILKALKKFSRYNSEMNPKELKKIFFLGRLCSHSLRIVRLSCAKAATIWSKRQQFTQSYSQFSSLYRRH